MKYKTAIVLFLAFLSFFSVSAQDYTFKVLINRGQNLLRTTDGKMVQLKPGQLVNDVDIIITSEKAYLGLVHKTGRIFDVRGAGSHRVSDLVTKMKDSKPGGDATSKYAQFISGKLTAGEKARIRQENRAVGDISINVFLPPSTELLGDFGYISWEVENDYDGTYTVIINDLFEDEVFTREVSENAIMLNFSEIENETNVFVISVKGTSQKMASPVYSIKRINEERPEVAAALEELKSEITGDSPLEMLLLAYFYVENDLLLDALTQYQRGMEKYPDELGTFYEIFLTNNGLK